MKLKSSDDFTPYALYLMFQFAAFSFFEDPDERETLAKDRVKRFQAIYDLAPEKVRDSLDFDALMQVTVYLFSAVERDGGDVPFVPNMVCYLDESDYEPKFAITKVLIKEKFLDTVSAMIFENKFLIGFESRIYDGLPICWNGDVNSIVTFFICWYCLGNIEKKSRFDVRIHGHIEENKKQGNPFLNIVTLICGKYIKSATGKNGHGNFLIKDKDACEDEYIDAYKKWHTVYRRYVGFLFQLSDYLDQLKEKVGEAGKDSAISEVPPETLAKIFDSHYREFKPESKEGIDNQVNKEVLEIFHSLYKPQRRQLIDTKGRNQGI